MNHPLQNYFLFPRYQSRADYEAVTGKTCPPFDPSKAPKYWADPAALTSVKRQVTYTVVAYAENGGVMLDELGRPMLDVLALTKAEAAAVNIPSGETNAHDATVMEHPVPLREFGATDHLVQVGPMAILMVSDGVPEPGAGNLGLSAQNLDKIMLAVDLINTLLPKLAKGL